MCQSPLHPFLEALPKCEHHMHLEGAIEPSLLFSLAAKNAIALPSSPEYASPETLQRRYAAFANLDDFLGYCVLISASDFEALAMSYFQRAAAQGVKHAEVFVDPQAHIERGVAFETIVAGFTAARRRAEAGLGVSSLLIMCLLRHLPLSNALSTFVLAREAGYFHAAEGQEEPAFAGLGMDSSEAPFPPMMWAEVFSIARDAGVRRTIHAGEEGPATYVSQALDVLGAQRIDHGIRALLEAEDEGGALLKRLVDEQVLLTLCPLSNVKLNCIRSIADFPLRHALKAGVRFSINSDDPAYFGGFILENYCALQEVFDLGVKEWERIARGAVMGSWCSDERKDKILKDIDDLVMRW
ncbi:adenosine deaminase [Xylariaceae sp. FL0255]|nr:adenosine deaminase [Xylariaceae sp. FL0255]